MEEVMALGVRYQIDWHGYCLNSTPLTYEDSLIFVTVLNHFDVIVIIHYTYS